MADLKHKPIKPPKTPSLIWNDAGGINLIVDKDGGNPVLILTGKKANSRRFWRKIQKLAAQALDEMN